jgi:2-desacetyl-2-hydroxyethyl bacteriochlorophyllide A dehydrogenase
MSKNPTVVFPQAKKATLENREIPRPKAGEVLLKTKCTMISIGTEMTAYSGEYPKGSSWEKHFSYPFFPGYNNIGIVEETGEGVDSSLIGKTFATWGSHAAYVVAEAQYLDPVPPQIPTEEAVFFTLAEIVMNGVRRSGVEWGESVVVYGLGLLGQLCARFCRLCGAGPVFAVDVAESRRARLPEDPLLIGIDPVKENVAEVVKARNHGRLADLVFEVTGNASLIPSEFAALRPQGRLVILSSLRSFTNFDFNDLCSNPSFTIIGAHNYSHPAVATPDNPWTQARHVQFFFDLITARQVDVGALITRRADYTEAAGLYPLLWEDRSNELGIIIDWSRA